MRLKTGKFICQRWLNGIEDALKQVFSTTPLQTCVVHYQCNLMNHICLVHKVVLGEALRYVFNPNRSDDTEEK